VCNGQAPGPQRAPLSPRACERPEQGRGPERRKNLERSGGEEDGSAGRGQFFSPDGWERRLRTLALKKKCRERA
jgi:hypothetical protein